MTQGLSHNSFQDSGAGRATRGNVFARYSCYVVLVLVLAVFAAVRFRYRDLPLERDEGEYAYMGQLMLQGIPPYQLAYTMKLPGTCAAYAVIMTVFGQTTVGIRLGIIVVTTFCAILVFLLGKYLHSLLAGTVAGITYVFLAIRPGVLGMDGHPTHFIVLTALAGILLLFRAINRERTILFFASGLMFGLAFLMKQPGILFGLFAGCYWLWDEWKYGLLWRNVIFRGGAFAAGVALPYGLVCLWLLHAGVFANFWFWTWTYAREYGSMRSLADGWRLDLRFTLPWAVRPFVLWETALIGLAAPLWSRSARVHGGFVTAFFITSLLAVCPGLYFRPHYFIVLLPAVAVCAGIAVDCAQHELHRCNLGRLAFVPLLFFAVAYLVSVRGQWRSYFHLNPTALNLKMCADGVFCRDNELVVDFIKAHATPGDQIGIFGSEPEICFYARLRCASGYIYAYPLMELQKFAGQMQNEMLGQLQSRRPRFLIYVDDEQSWGWSRNFAKNLPFLDHAWNFAHAGYDLVDQVPIPDPGGHTQYLRGDQPQFYVFERKAK
jgi:hypothetical protein